MRRGLSLLVLALLLYGGGLVSGVKGFQRFDPLRQDSAPMEQWFAANIHGDAKTLWADTSKDYQQHQYNGDYNAFLADFGSSPSKSPPRITFIASVKLAGFDSEMFYDVEFTTHEHATLTLYVDSDGKFDGWAM
jgi:hypothetical protein